MTQVDNLKNEIRNLKRKLKYYKEFSAIVETRLSREQYERNRERQTHSMVEQKYTNTISELLNQLKEE